MKPLKPIFWGLLLVLGIAFFLQNKDALTHKTTLELTLFGPLKFRTLPIALYAFTLLSFLLGLLVSALYGLVEIYRLRKALRTTKRQNDSLQEELKSLRNLPITETEIVASHSSDKLDGESERESEVANSGKTNVMDG